jgi:hypothetical protein
MNLYELNYPMKIPSSSIGLLIVVNDDIPKEYEQHIASLTCYAYQNAYRFILIHPKQYPKCTNMTQSIYFQKHCLVSMYLRENTQIQWLLVLDMNVLVLNISKKIESYLPDANTKSLIHLILYERFNGEIMAGNYLIHNHRWSHRFLSRWMEYEHYISHFKFHNNDNGALHIHLLSDMVGDASELTYTRCFGIYENAIDAASYHTYVGCCKCALGGRWELEHVRILRRGHSFVRDCLGYEINKLIWSPTDFLLDAHKINADVYYWKTIDKNQCVNWDWILPIREDAIITNYTSTKEIVRKYDREAAEGYPQSIGLPDISECWPNCIDNEIRRQAFIEKVCHQIAA